MREDFVAKPVTLHALCVDACPDLIRVCFASFAVNCPSCHRGEISSPPPLLAEAVEVTAVQRGCELGLVAVILLALVLAGRI
jgi:hypothetical protein